MIVEENVDTFLFGSKSQFDDLCYQVVSELKVNYTYIKRIYVRAQFPYINNNYRNYLLQRYEDTYYPDSILKAGKAAYVERNYEMINKSNFCIIYFDKNYSLFKQNEHHMNLIVQSSKSGTKIAYDYAIKKQKTIINIARNIE